MSQNPSAQMIRPPPVPQVSRASSAASISGSNMCQDTSVQPTSLWVVFGTGVVSFQVSCHPGDLCIRFPTARWNLSQEAVLVLLLAHLNSTQLVVELLQHRRGLELPRLLPPRQGLNWVHHHCSADRAPM